MRIRTLVLTAMLISCSIGTITSAIAADECQYTVQSVPTSIHALLAPHYVANTAGSALKAVHGQLETLMLEALHCRAVTQSQTARSSAAEQELVEWHSVDQWLYRLVNFIGLNAKGDQSIDWRREFETFAEVYELEI